MLKRTILWLLCILVLGPAWSAWAGLDADLVGWWSFDEGEGTVAYDGSGNGNDGTLSGGTTWTTGYLDGALEFDGSDAQVVAPYIELDDRSFTIAMWINPVLSASAIVFSQNESSSTNLNLHIRFGASGSDDAPDHGIRFGFYSNDLVTDSDIVDDNTWTHVVCSYDVDSGDRKVFINGEEIAQDTSDPFEGTSGDTIIGSWTSSQYFDGIIDDVQLYHRALSDNEVKRIMSGLADTSLAADPSPEDKATDVVRDVTLSWEAGETAATHNVYLGTSYDDVNDGAGTLVSEGQTGTSYTPDSVLEFGQTYYWRIDEVNASPDNTVFTGEIWSFTVEPFTYPIEDISVVSNGTSDETFGPENTINGSGLDDDDLHSFTATDMWLAVPGEEALYLQYEFDRVYKLYEMQVWNYNVQWEIYLGFSVKDVTIEYSTDGIEWTVLGDFVFAQGTGVDGAAADTTVDFQGLAVRYVKLTINSNYGAVKYGLSEVQFLYIPSFAREPEPADGASEVDVASSLTWRAGREAVVHDVYFGADASAWTVESVSENVYSPDEMDFGTIYNWQVDEVNEADAITVWEGDLWTFATQEFALIEGFESYEDENTEDRIYMTWIDGLDGVDNTTGSVVGYDESPFAEQSIVNSGSQSMPLYYDNSASPYYSEAWRDFGSEDWTANGADTLKLCFQGRAATFVEREDGSYLMGAGGADIWDSSDEFRFAYKELTGNGSITARVDSVYNSNGWAKAGVMIRQNLKATAVNTSLVVTPENGVAFQYRETAGGSSSNTTASASAPQWVKLTRTGDVFTAQYSSDGTTWTDLAFSSALELEMNDKVYIGLALTSHDEDIMTNAEFSNVSTTGSVSGDWQVEAIGADQEGNEAVSFYVALEDTSGNLATVSYPDDEAALTTEWTSWEIPYSDFAGVNLAKVSKMYIGLGDRDNPSAGGSGLIYIDDIQCGRPGLYSERADGSIVMYADGSDIWGTSDEFRFAYKALTGDGSIVTRVDGLANTNSWAKAGVMIRQSSDADSANAGIFVTAENGISFQYRAIAGDSCSNVAESGLAAPYWVKVTRTGDVFTAQYSADGATWTDLAFEDADVSIEMADPVLIGVALTSHEDGTLTYGDFSNIETTGDVSGDWTFLGIGLD